MRNRSLSIKLAFVIAVLLTACNNHDSQSKDEVRIGVLMSLTGSSATYGQATKKGIDLALDELNADTAVKTKFSLVVEDDKSTPNSAASATQKMITADNVKAIIGSFPSSCTIAASSVAEKNKVVLISPGSSNPNITNAGDFIFRNWISDIYEGEAMAKYLYDIGLRKISILYIKNDYGDGLNGVLSKKFSELGGTITSSNAYQQDATDFRTLLTKLKNESPEAIYLVGYYKEMAQLLNQGTEMNIHFPVYSSVCFEDGELLKIAGKNAEGVIYTTPYFNINDSSKAFTDFREKYMAKYKEDPDVYAAHGYDAMKIIAEAVAHSGNDAEKIKSYLYNVKNYDGVSGNTTFDQNGDVIKPVMFKIVKDGKFQIFNPPAKP
jgi:branched-chain amino acid transport system substrate-binding protein